MNIQQVILYVCVYVLLIFRAANEFKFMIDVKKEKNNMMTYKILVFPFFFFFSFINNVVLLYKKKEGKEYMILYDLRGYFLRIHCKPYARKYVSLSNIVANKFHCTFILDLSVNKRT